MQDNKNEQMNLEDFLASCAYLTDKDNLIIENRIFIDLVWELSKSKTEKARNLLISEGSLTEQQAIKKIQNTKSYIIRNAGIMLNHIFYWHYTYLKKNKKTFFRYNYKGKFVNVIKKEEADWWDELRLTSKEITSANKLLIDLGLIEIHVMKVVRDGQAVPSNCYQLLTHELAKHLKNLVDIQKKVYYEKVLKVKIARKNYKLQKKNKKLLAKLLTKLLTCKSGSPVTGDTTLLNGYEDSTFELSTLSTLSTEPNNAGYTVTECTKENPVTKCTKENPVTGCIKEDTVTKCTNKAVFTNNITYSDTTEQNSSFCFNTQNDLILEHIKQIVSDLSYITWIAPYFSEAKLVNNNLIISVPNEFTKEVLETKFLPQILNEYKRGLKLEKLNIFIEVAIII